MGSALSVFNDFATATGPAYITGPEQIVNEATKQNYLLRRYLKGKGPEEVLQGGKTIKDAILFDEDSTFQYYQPNETFTWKNPQVLSEYEINWRFCVDHMSWTDAEIELNIGAGLSRSARHQAFKRLLRVKEQRLWTSLLNGMEDGIFAVPNTAQMESAAGTRPYSIPAFITEDGQLPRDADTTQWSTVEGISPTTQAKWRNQVEYYDHVERGFATADDQSKDLIAAFDRMYLSVKFMAPPTRQEYFENDNLYRQFIACSKAGITQYEQLMRSRQDRFAAPSMHDPAFLKPTYGGIELEYVSALDSAKLYKKAGASTMHAEGAEANLSSGTTDRGDGVEEGYAGPRYWWINANYLTPVFHSKRYMTKHPVLTHPNQPFTHVQPIDCWMNMVCRSRRRQGIICPTDGAEFTV